MRFFAWKGLDKGIASPAATKHFYFSILLFGENFSLAGLFTGCLRLFSFYSIQPHFIYFSSLGGMPFLVCLNHSSR